MHLSPHELSSLLVFSAGRLSQSRLSRGVRLNVVESVALISHVLQELIRDGQYSVAECMNMGRKIIGVRQVMDGVQHMIDEIQIEATFPDGTKLVTVHQPIVQQDGDLHLALYGSGMTVPTLDTFLQGVHKYQVAATLQEPQTQEETQQKSNKKQKRKRPTQAAEEAASSSSSSSSSPSPVTAASPLPLPLPPGQCVSLPSRPSVLLNASRRVVALSVMNYSDRPIQVGSHFHFIETNAALSFDRAAAYGHRLNISSGTAVRFEPGERKRVQLVQIGGRRRITGGNRLATGTVDQSRVSTIVQQLVQRGFRHVPEVQDSSSSSSAPLSTLLIPSPMYLSMYGPATGDRIHLGDTGLIAEIEYDFVSSGGTLYGDECVFGGGKSLREGMGQCTGVDDTQALDLLLCNATVIDWKGIYRADIGVKNGVIVGIGKSGNPDIMDGVHPQLIFGVNTDVINAAGLIVTAGAIDSHVHFICPQLCTEALAVGITTMIGGGTGPSSGTSATTCTPSPFYARAMLQATDNIPINIGLTGKGNTADRAGLQAQLTAGCMGLKLHEDWGSTPAAIDTCLTLADEQDILVNIHTDTLNESCSVEQTIAAINGRVIHAYHSEGAGGGHAPDIITVCGINNIIPSSTNPTRPYTINTIDEHMDMLMVCHHLKKGQEKHVTDIQHACSTDTHTNAIIQYAIGHYCPFRSLCLCLFAVDLTEDIAFAESRIRGETIGAEDVLHDIGAISIMSSDSQAMGRQGEVITRTWQTAAKMKIHRGQLNQEQQDKDEEEHPLFPRTASASSYSTPNDNYRIRRYVAKYTVNPAIVSGISHCVGTIGVGLMADLILYRPALFGVKPEMVIKGGLIVNAQMGNANASIPTPQPVIMSTMFGGLGAAAASCSLAFVSRAAVERPESPLLSYNLQKRVECVRNCRKISKRSLKLNSATPSIKVDPETFVVSVEGQAVYCEPAATLPLTTRYFLF